MIKELTVGSYLFYRKDKKHESRYDYQKCKDLYI